MTLRPNVPLEKESLRQILNRLRKQEARNLGSVIEFVEHSDNVKVATDVDRKLRNGGIPRGRFLVMIPIGLVAEKSIPHFQLLRKIGHSDTPTSQEDRRSQWACEQQSKLINNEVTVSDLNYEIFECSVVGAYAETKTGKIEFIDEPGDSQCTINYRVYVPDAPMLDLIVNLIQLTKGQYFRIGSLRESQSGSLIQSYKEDIVPVYARQNDFVNKRTGIFGKTRKGKSNIAKTIMLMMDRTVSQLVFDIGGEYCNPNPQDYGKCIADMIPNSVTFGVSAKPEHPGRKLICPDFYLYPRTARQKLLALLRQENQHLSDYVGAAMSVDIPSIEEVRDRTGQDAFDARPPRKIKIFWAILQRAGFEVNDTLLPHLFCGSGFTSSRDRGKFSLGLGQNILREIYTDLNNLPRMDTLEAMVVELEQIFALYNRLDDHARNDIFSTQGRNPVFDSDDIALFKFLFPTPGRSGPEKFRKYRKYHQLGGGNGTTSVIAELDEGRTVFVDLDREDPDLMELTCRELTTALFEHRIQLFTSGNTEARSVMVYFEEAQDLIPKRPSNSKEPESIYEKLAKRGAKLGIGIVYISQDLSSMFDGLLSQTENWFAVHISSQKQIDVLCSYQSAFEEHAYDINRIKAVGYARMYLENATPFVLPIQADRFIGNESPKLETDGGA